MARWFYVTSTEADRAEAFKAMFEFVCEVGLNLAVT